MTEDSYQELTFLLGIKKTNKGLSASNVWNRSRPKNTDEEERLIWVTLEIPESLWAYPKLKGKLESRLEEEFQAFLVEAKEEDFA